MLNQLSALPVSEFCTVSPLVLFVPLPLVNAICVSALLSHRRARDGDHDLIPVRGHINAKYVIGQPSLPIVNLGAIRRIEVGGFAVKKHAGLYRLPYARASANMRPIMLFRARRITAAGAKLCRDRFTDAGLARLQQLAGIWSRHRANRPNQRHSPSRRIQ